MSGIIPNPLILDVSEYQSSKAMNYEQLAKQINLVIVRVQYGNIEDKEYKNHIAGFSKQGVPIAAYAYFAATSEADAKGEAQDFYKRTKSYGFSWYWIDVETATAPNMRNAVAAYVKELRSLIGPDAHIGAYIANHMYAAFNLNIEDFDALWIPAYGVDDGTYNGTNPSYPCDLHQFTDQGRLAGYAGNVDLSRLTLTHSRGLDFFSAAKKATTASANSVAAPKTAAAGLTSHKIAAGDTLSALALRFGTTVEAIQKANNMGSSTLIIVGNTLLIPTASTSKKTLKVGSLVKVNQTAAKWATGEAIPSWVKGKTYTVQKLRNNNEEALLQDVLSWISAKDITVQD